MSDTGHLQNLAVAISTLRKQQGLTQEALAERLGLTFQAVSKWENFQSSPDIQLLPRLAEIFQVSVDRLFGMEKPVSLKEKKEAVGVQSLVGGANNAEIQPLAGGANNADIQPLTGGTGLVDVQPVAGRTSLCGELPWADDGTLRVVLYRGRTLLKADAAEEPKMVFRYEGAALNVESRISVECGAVGGSVQAGRDIRCENVGGGASANRDVLCFDVQGGASGGRDVQCADVGTEVSAGQDVRCGDVKGDASAGRDISCGDVGGSVNAMGKVVCGDVGGGINTLGPVSYTGSGEEKASRDDSAGEAAIETGRLKGSDAMAESLHRRIHEESAEEEE